MSVIRHHWQVFFACNTIQSYSRWNFFTKFKMENSMMINLLKEVSKMAVVFAKAQLVRLPNETMKNIVILK